MCSTFASSFFPEYSKYLINSETHSWTTFVVWPNLTRTKKFYSLISQCLDCWWETVPVKEKCKSISLNKISHSSYCVSNITCDKLWKMHYLCVLYTNSGVQNSLNGFYMQSQIIKGLCGLAWCVWLDHDSNVRIQSSSNVTWRRNGRGMADGLLERVKKAGGQKRLAGLCERPSAKLHTKVQ